MTVDQRDWLRQLSRREFLTGSAGIAASLAAIGIPLAAAHAQSAPAPEAGLLVLDKVVQNASRAKAEFVLDLGDNVAWRGSREFPQTDAGGAVAAYARYRRQIGPLSMHSPHFAVIGNWGGESGKFPEKSIQT